MRFETMWLTLRWIWKNDGQCEKDALPSIKKGLTWGGAEEVGKTMVISCTCTPILCSEFYAVNFSFGEH